MDNIISTPSFYQQMETFLQMNYHKRLKTFKMCAGVIILMTFLLLICSNLTP